MPKNAPGLRGFPTPNDIPQDGGYVVFRVPKDNQWAGLILGAAQLLSYSWNWYESGDMTPDEAAEVFRQIVDQAPYETCGCEQPGGRRILRVNRTGNIEQLTDGEWTPPTDDYEIPPVPAREEATCEERRCAAAANCAHVLEQLYEEVADAVAEGADEAEALAVMIGVAIIIIGGWLGLAIAALVGLATGYFFSFLEIAEFMTADLWTSDFTDKLECMLYECSICDGDVVTFDFQCVREKMASYTDLLDVNFVTNVRLFGQVDFILNVIGVDGLNAAGATTAVTDADCSDCVDDWCYVWDFEHNGADLPEGTTMENMEYVEGVGYKISGENPPGHYDGFLLVPISPTAWGMNGAGASYYVQPGGGAACYIFNYPEGDTIASAGSGNQILNTDDVEPWTNLVFYVGTDAGTDSVVRQITFYGTGTNPFGFNNCPD